MPQSFNVEKTEIEGLYIINPFVSEDRRGDFVKDYSCSKLKEYNIEHPLQEVFYAFSKKGVIRGMHFQMVKQQAKLVRCLHGEIFDVVVDLRKDSNTFKCWKGFELSKDNHKAVLVPVGCAHGYLVIEDALVSYKCDEEFYPQGDSGLLWWDEDLNIDWPLEKIGGSELVITSDKDENLNSFKWFEKEIGGF